MPWQKLSLSRLRDARGSAAIDFLVVLVPTSLLCLPLVGLSSLFHQSVVDQQRVYEIARFASLADSSSSATELFRSSTDESASIRYSNEKQGCFVTVAKMSSHQTALWPSAVEIVSEARVKCELE
jgi:Flp pilus assembly protein TadG